MQNRFFIAIILLAGLILVGCQPEVETEDAPAPTPEALATAQDTADEVEPEPTAELEQAPAEEAEPTAPPPTPTEDSKFPATSTPIPEDGATEEETNMHPNVTKAIDDLTGRMAVSADAVKVLSVENKTWSDSSLGCPQEGFMYAQALVEGGMLIQLEIGGTVYNYHSGPDSDPFLCENK